MFIPNDLKHDGQNQLRYLCPGGVNVYLYSVYIDNMSYIEYSMNLDEHSIPLTLP